MTTRTPHTSHTSRRLFALLAVGSLALGTGCAVENGSDEIGTVRVVGQVIVDSPAPPTKNSGLTAQTVSASSFNERGPSGLTVVVLEAGQDSAVLVEAPDGSFDIQIANENFSLCIFDDQAGGLGCLSNGNAQVFRGQDAREIDLGTVRVFTAMQVVLAENPPQAAPRPGTGSAEEPTKTLGSLVEELGHPDFGPAA